MKFTIDYNDVAYAYRMARAFLECECPFNTVCAITIPDIYPEKYDPNDPNDFENLVGMYGNDGIEMRAYCIGCHKRTKFVCGLDKIPYISNVAIDCVHDVAAKNGCFHWDRLDISPRLLPFGVDRTWIWLMEPPVLTHKVYCHKCRKVFDVSIQTEFSVDVGPLITTNAW